MLFPMHLRLQAVCDRHTGQGRPFLEESTRQAAVHREWLEGKTQAGGWLRDMAERLYDVDTVDVADVSASCWAENTCQRCVSDAGAAVLVFILDVAVSALVINRESGVMRGSPAKLRVYHPQGRMATDSQDLDASLN
jgi:hypothetical protein